MYCPLCGKGNVVDKKCTACGYVVGSDPDIDGNPTPVGGYSDQVLIEAKQRRKDEIGSVLFGLGMLFVVVGLIVFANGGTWIIAGIGLVIWIYRFVTVFMYTSRTVNRAWRNRTMYWAYGEEPDWKRNRKR